MTAIALVPVGLYAIGQLNLQMTLTDEHAAVSHYSGIAFYSALTPEAELVRCTGEPGVGGSTASERR